MQIDKVTRDNEQYVFYFTEKLNRHFGQPNTLYLFTHLLFSYFEDEEPEAERGLDSCPRSELQGDPAVAHNRDSLLPPSLHAAVEQPKDLGWWVKQVLLLFSF